MIFLKRYVDFFNAIWYKSSSKNKGELLWKEQK